MLLPCPPSCVHAFASRGFYDMILKSRAHVRCVRILNISTNRVVVQTYLQCAHINYTYVIFEFEESDRERERERV